MESSCIRVTHVYSAGKLLYQLHEVALHMLELLKECNVIANSLIRKSLVSNGSIKWFTSLKNVKVGSVVVQNPNEVCVSLHIVNCIYRE